MKLFKYEGYKVVISEYAYALKPFRAIWNRDRSVSKDKAIMELSYIYFMLDPRSDYSDIMDEAERSKSIIDGMGLEGKWKPDKLVLEGMGLYKSFIPMASKILEATKILVDKLNRLLLEIDLGAVDEKGKPIYTLNTITSTVKQIPELIRELDTAERALIQELKESKMRGSGEKTLFEDGLNF